MSARDDLKAKLKAKSQEAVKLTDEALKDGFQTLKDATSTDLEKLRPKITDQAAYDQLIAAVTEATNRNESIAQFRERLEKLGSTTINVFNKATSLLKV